MAREEPGYALKSPRGRSQNLVAMAIDRVEDGIYVIVAVLLVLAGAFVLWSAAAKVADDIRLQVGPDALVIDALDKGLILFIVAELLHTVRVTIQERTLVVEPFLIVALIAGVRRLLLVTAQVAVNGGKNGTTKFEWSTQGVEITVLLALVLGITLALVLWHRFQRTGEETA